MSRRANKKLPPRERLLQLFTYNPLTGLLVWNITNGNNAIKGSIAGCRTPAGYIVVGIDGQLYMAHRIIWKMLYNEEPEEIDHIDLIKDNNREVNLRKSDCVTNQHNHKIQSRNKTGIKGLCIKTNQYGTIYYSAELCCRGIRYRKTFTYSLEGKELAVVWLKQHRESLHGEFTNHG